jgi:hypothetical protein
MRDAALLLAALTLASCRLPTSSDRPKGESAPVVAQISFEPNALCSALNEAGLVGTRWKEGAGGYGCATNELPVGPRAAGATSSSTVWYEIRGTDANSATTIVLGGDVRAPEADTAIKAKLVDFSAVLLRKMNMSFDEEFRNAILTDTPFEKRVGNYVVRYASQIVGKVREDRLTIQRAL